MTLLLDIRKKYGKYPLLTEIAKGIGITSKGVAHRYVKSLEKAGKILRFSNKHRGISTIDKRPLFLKSLGEGLQPEDRLKR
jgi:repressor LexA